MSYFTNILLSNTFSPSYPNPVRLRKSGDWYHSIAILTGIPLQSPEFPLDTPVKCIIIDFCKGPIVSVHKSNIKKITHTVFTIDSYLGSYGTIGTIRVNTKTYIPPSGYTDFVPGEIILLACRKWGKIPYVHGYSESYNCAGFTDDLLYFLFYKKWNPRIIKNHEKYNLVI